MNCKICSSINKKNKIKYIYSFLKKKYYKCLSCDLVFQYPQPSKDDLKKIYDKEYFNQNYKQKNLKLKLRKEQYSLDKNIILNYFKDNKNKNILDYGCGNGNFLKIFKSNKYGYEFNFDAEIHKSIIRLSNKKVFKKKYDLIIMRGVIEHISNFDSIVKKLCKSLKKGGIFYITATPNINNLTFYLSNKDFNQNHPGHIYHFNNVNLSLLFLKNNLLNIDTIFQYSKTPYSNFKKNYKSLLLQLKQYNKKIKTRSPAAVGNMMTMIFKKMV